MREWRATFVDEMEKRHDLFRIWIGGLCLFLLLCSLVALLNAPWWYPASSAPAPSALIVRMAPANARARRAYASCLMAALPAGRHARVDVDTVMRCHRRAAGSHRAVADQRALIAGMLSGRAPVAGAAH